MSIDSYGFDRHPGLTPLVIDLIPDRTRAEIEATIDSPLSVERWPSGWENRSKTNKQVEKTKQRHGGVEDE